MRHNLKVTRWGKLSQCNESDMTAENENENKTQKLTTLPMIGFDWTLSGSMSSWSRNFSIRFSETAAWFTKTNYLHMVLYRTVQFH